MPLSVSCTGNGNGFEQLPEEPDGTMTHSLTYGDTFGIDCFGTLLSVDGDSMSGGSDVRFAMVGECASIADVVEIPREGWSSSVVLCRGYGYVASYLTDEGCVMAAIYLQDITEQGVMTLKTLSPIYGRFGRFAINVKQLNLPSVCGDTTIYIIHPTTYRVKAETCDWLRIEPSMGLLHISYDALQEGDRSCSLQFENEIFESVAIPIMQSAQ